MEELVGVSSSAPLLWRNAAMASKLLPKPHHATAPVEPKLPIYLFGRVPASWALVPTPLPSFSCPRLLIFLALLLLFHLLPVLLAPLSAPFKLLPSYLQAGSVIFPASWASTHSS